MCHEIIALAVKAYKKIEKDELEGVRPMYRERHWKYEKREKAKLEKRQNWHRKGGYQPVDTKICTSYTS